MRSFTINDGLVSNQVRAFYEDSKGNIWIMTWEGLSRFDGRRFRNYSLTDGLVYPMINAMTEDSENGNLYIAENDGTLDVIVNGVVQQALRRYYVNAINKLIQDPAGIIMAPSDEKGICVFDKGLLTPLNTSGINFSVVDLIPVGKYFFFCGLQSGVMLHDHTIIKRWPITFNDYTSILKDQFDRIWVGTGDGPRWVNLTSGYSQYDLVPTSFNLTPWSRWPIRDLLQTTDGSIWIAAIGGLIQIKPDQSWRVYTRKDGLPTDYVTSVYEDKEGMLWIGTDQGIALLDIKNTIDQFRIGEDLPNNKITDILPSLDGGAYMISNDSFLFKIALNRPIQPIITGNVGRIYEFIIVKNDTLITTDKGRFQIFNNKVNVWNEIPFSPAWISVETKDGNIFSSVNDTINISTRAYHYKHPALKNFITALSDGIADEFWVGTQKDGLFQANVKLNPAGKIELDIIDFSAYVPDKNIRSLHVDQQGHIWVGTRNIGLIQLIPDSVNGGYVSHTYNHKDGLTSDFVKTITSDPDGNIWVGTFTGIEKLIPTNDGFRIFSFSKVNNFFATVSKLILAHDKSIWGITNSGVIRIKDGLYELVPPAEAYIANVVTAQKTLIDPLNQLPFDLNYDQNYIDIEFSSNDHINGNQTLYSYRLTGSQDTSWSLPLPVHKVSYANLLPADYRFEVRLLGWNDQYGKITTYKFRIRPPFWQRIWFMVLASLALLGILFLFYKYRIRQFQHIQEVRDRIASDLHDEIGSSLTHVNILSEIGKKTAEPDGSSLQLFKRIGEEVQSSSEALDDIIWSVSSRAETAEDLVSRMRRYASELFDVKGISFMLQEEKLEDNQKIELELRRDFYLIYKELLRNILRHAEATEVKIRIREEDQFLWLSVSDNGHGFDPNAHTIRQGLHSIRGRIAKWRGHISIDSSDHNGTHIKIGLPLRRT